MRNSRINSISKASYQYNGLEKMDSFQNLRFVNWYRFKFNLALDQVFCVVLHCSQNLVTPSLKCNLYLPFLRKKIFGRHPSLRLSFAKIPLELQWKLIWVSKSAYKQIDIDWILRDLFRFSYRIPNQK